MRRLFFFLAILLCPVFVVAQQGGGSTGTGAASTPTTLESAANLPEWQGFETLGNTVFVGVPNTPMFIGVEQDSLRTTNPRRSTTTTATARRSTTTARMATSRTNTMGRSSLSMSNSRSVRATASSEVAFSPMEVSDRTAAIQTRITRLPNFRAVPDQVAVRMEGGVVTLTGAVATPHERKLAEQLVRLEPGVAAVDNQLAVTGTE